MKAARKKDRSKASTLSVSKNESSTARSGPPSVSRAGTFVTLFGGGAGGSGGPVERKFIPSSGATFNLPRFAHQRHAMLYGFSLAGEDGYTDEQAAKAANINLRSCYWKRASELRQFGYIEPVRVGGSQLTRKSDLNGIQGVWRITKAGRKQLELWGWR